MVKRVRRDFHAGHSPDQLSPVTVTQPSPRPADVQMDAARPEQPVSAVPAATAVVSKPSAAADPTHTAAQAAPAPPLPAAVADTTEGSRGRPEGARTARPASETDAGGKPASNATAQTEGGSSQHDRRTTRSQPSVPAHEGPASGAQTSASPSSRAALTAACTDATAHEQSAGEDATRSVVKDPPTQRQAKPKQSPLALRVSRGSAGPAAAAKMHRAAVQGPGWKRKAAALSDGSAKVGAALPPPGNKRGKQQKAAAAAAAKAFVRAPRFDSVASKAGTKRAEVKLAPWQVFETPLRFRSHGSLDDASDGAQQKSDVVCGQAHSVKTPANGIGANAEPSQLAPEPTASAQTAAGPVPDAAATWSAKAQTGSPATLEAARRGASSAAAPDPRAEAPAGAANRIPGDASAVITPALRPATRSAAPAPSANGAAVSTASPAANGGFQLSQLPNGKVHAEEEQPAEVAPMMPARRSGLRRQTAEGQVRPLCRRAYGGNVLFKQHHRQRLQKIAGAFVSRLSPYRPSSAAPDDDTCVKAL